MINECNECGATFAATDRDEESCPDCGSRDIIFDIDALEADLAEDEIY